MKEKKLKFCSLRLEEDKLAQISKIAKENKLSRSNFIRQTLMEKLDNQKLLTLD